MPCLPRALRLAIILGLATILFPAAVAAQSPTITFDPDVTAFDLDPGETQIVTATVCLPGHIVKADIYLLADVTTSMVPVLGDIRSNAALIVDGLLATGDADIAVGIGSYRDFPFDPKQFIHQVSSTKSTAALIAGINAWFPTGGGDVSEGQYYALYKLATDPSIGFRPDAKRIVVWFGDSPAHDPICAVLNGLGTPTFPITEALVKSSLQAAGPLGGTTVIAISTPTNFHFPLALNDDPQADAGDYASFCSVGGSMGQADRIAQATGGISTLVTDPPSVVAAIQGAVEALFEKVDIGCAVSGTIAPFVADITPPFYNDVAVPTNTTDPVCVTFQILLQGPPCAKQGQIFHGSLDVNVNGTPLASHPLALSQPSCNPLVGQLWLGLRRIPPLQLPGGGPTDVMHILPTFSQHVQLEHLPVFQIPNEPALQGLKIYAQCALFDAKDFPEDAIKTSNGLVMSLGVTESGYAYGVESGLHLSMNHWALIPGPLAMECVLTP